MEKILDENEKIRRAEELYYRRNNKILPTNKENYKIKNSIKSKILFQLLIILNIAVIVVAIQNKDFIFTKDFLGILEEYNSNISLKITEKMKNILKEKEEVEQEVTSENLPVIEDTKEEVTSSLNEMDLDVENLKAAYSFIVPVKGRISSGFGARESEYQNVRGYHTGTDIAKEKGSKIVAAMGGIVDLVSSEGDYGKHIKIRCNNVSTLYAHCSKIYVKQGQIVAQGQEIGEVGSTGNSTGPHLHFEIRIDNRFIDPQRIIDF